MKDCFSCVFLHEPSVECFNPASPCYAREVTENTICDEYEEIVNFEDSEE